MFGSPKGKTLVLVCSPIGSYALSDGAIIWMANRAVRLGKSDWCSGYPLQLSVGQISLALNLSRGFSLQALWFLPLLIIYFQLMGDINIVGILVSCKIYHLPWANH